MTLKVLFQKALTELEWEDEIKHDESDNTDYINTGFTIDGQTYRLTLYTDEEKQFLSILMKSPINIPRIRHTEAAVVINALNTRMRLGNLECNDEGGVYYRWTMDVEDSTPSTTQLKNMIRSASGVFDELRVGAIGSVAFTKLSASEILSEYESNIEKMQQESQQGAEGPSEL
jgi:hypothetical protein